MVNREEYTKQKVVSIIVPIYNGAGMIQRCISSVRKQTFTNWELILIDDGSTDATKSICQKNVTEDNKIKYFYQRNQGVSAARNNGINQSIGDILFFLDADDTINEDLVQQISQEWDDGVELILFDYYEVVDGKKTLKKMISKRELISSDELKYNMFFGYENDEASQNQLNAAPWGKAFKKNILIDFDIRFSEKLFYCEDRAFNAEYYSHISCAKHVEIPEYYYYINEQSVSGQTRNASDEYSNRLIDNFVAYEKIVYPIIFEDIQRDNRFTIALYNEIVNVLKIILWTAESDKNNTSVKRKREFCKHCVQIIREHNLYNKNNHMGRVLVAMCKMRMFGVLNILIKIRKSSGT